MKQKLTRNIVIACGILLALLLYQNLTPSEIDESLNSALSDQAKTADAIKENIRGPASVSSSEQLEEKTFENK